MAHLYPNLTGQQGIYYIGSPDYVDVKDTYLPLQGMRTFYQTSINNSQDLWAKDDILAVNIQKDTENYKIWTGSWDLPNKRIKKVTEETSIGTINNGNNVDIIATLSTVHMKGLLTFSDPIIIGPTPYYLPLTAHGQTLIGTNTGITYVMLPANNPIGFYCRIIREQNTINISPPSGEVVNNIFGAFNMTTQYSQAFVYKLQTGIWIVICEQS